MVRKTRLLGRTNSKLKRQRQFCGVTQHAMALSVRMSYNRYCEIEQGHREPTTAEKQSILRVLRRFDGVSERPNLFDKA